MMSMSHAKHTAALVTPVSLHNAEQTKLRRAEAIQLYRPKYFVYATNEDVSG